MKKGEFLVILVFLLAIIVRLIPANTAFLSEENIWIKYASGHSLTSLGAFGVYFDDTTRIWPHPSLSMFIYKIFGIAFNNATWGYRLDPILFGTLSLTLVYLLVRRYVSKQAAFVSLILMGFSFWHIIASTGIDMDGSILTFMFLLFTYCFLRYEEKKERKWLIAAGIAGGIGFLMKITMVAIFGSAALYVLTKNLGNLRKGEFWKRIKQNVTDSKGFLLICLISAIIFAAYLFWADYSGLGILNSIIEHGEGSLNKMLSVKPFISMFFFGTPLMFLFLFFYFVKKYKSWNRLEHMSTSWIVLTFFLYFFVIGVTKGPFERYLMVLIPPIIILTASLINALKFTRKDATRFAVMLLISFAALYALDFIPAGYVGDDPASLINNVLHLDFNINIPVMANTEPGIWISFIPIALTSVILGVAALCLAVFRKARKNFKSIFIFMLAVSFALNLVYVQEYVTHSTHPDFSKAVYETINYYEQSGFTGRLFSNQFHYFYYLNKTGINFNYYDRVSPQSFTPEQIRNSTAIVGNYYPSMSDEEKSILKQYCRLDKTFSDKGYVLTEIYSC